MPTGIPEVTVTKDGQVVPKREGVLIPDWRNSWRFSSVQAGIALGFIDACYAANFFGLQERIGHDLFAFFNALIVAVVIPLLRNLQQAPAPVAPEVKDALLRKAISIPVHPQPTPTDSGDAS